MTRFRFTAHGAAAALVLNLAGLPLAAAQPQATYPQATYPQVLPGGYRVARYEPPSYQPPPTTDPTVAAGAATFPTARSATLAPPTSAANYRFAPQTTRYAMLQGTEDLEVPPPPSTATESLPPAPPEPVAAGAEGVAGGSDAASSLNWESYVQTPQLAAGWNNLVGAEGGYDSAACDYGTFGGGGAACGEGHCGREWFFGIYALYMSRDNPSNDRLAVRDNGLPFPTSADVVLSTLDAEPEFQWGAEVRFGSTFGPVGDCDAGCGSAPYAWEVVYWGLDDNEQVARVTTDLGGDRIRSMVDYTGIGYDRDGAGGAFSSRPVNDFFDQRLREDPTNPNDLRVLGIRARSNFTAQNLELNFIRFPVASGSHYPANGSSRLMANGVAGVRYLRLDDDLQLGAMFSTDDGPGGEPDAFTGFSASDDNVLFHDISTDNDLVGFQFGSNLNWIFGAKWSAFGDTQLGIYGNRISSHQRVWSGGGGSVTFDSTGGIADVRSHKTDVSFLGEVRLGVGYQFATNMRWTTAYRVIAITGVALSNEQIATDWTNAAHVGTIDSNDSIVLHGLQTGLEWKY